MKNLFVAFALVLAACAHSKPGTETAASAAAEQPAVDPTVPSWAPKSCVAYHKAVVEALGCQAIEEDKRDQIKQKYDTKSAEWRALTDAKPEQLPAIDTACVSDTDAVHSATTGKCDAAKH